MDTLKIKKAHTKMIAHRGLSGIETENTAAAFTAAANRTYYGIETDVHVTADGKFIIIHDDDTKRVSDSDYSVEQTDFDTLRSLKLHDNNGLESRSDLVMPTPEEYFSICKKYGKKSVFELKNDMDKKYIVQLAKLIDKTGWLENTIFISFSLDNLIKLKSEYPNQPAQYLTGDLSNPEQLAKTLKTNGLGLDAYFGGVTKQTVDIMHQNGVEVNVWTVNSADDAHRLIDMGVDYITTNILE